MNKNISLILSSSQTPYRLSIFTCDGAFIDSRHVTQSIASFCLCTNACCVRLVATYNNQTITKRIPLLNCRCQRVSVNFYFTPIPQPRTQTFTLTDENYGLPVADAILTFEK